MSRLRSIATALVAAAALPATAAAQATPWYILDGDHQTAFVVQHGAVQSTFSLPLVNGYPLYAPWFDGTNLLVSSRDGAGAVQFTAAGVATGTTYSNGAGVDQILDGAGDGTYTYAARCCSAVDGIYRGNLQFGGMTRISTVGNAGVAFASSTGTLFATDFGGNLFELTLTGTLLNTYGTGISNPTALAYEASTNSLWMARNGSSEVYNYSLGGEQLQTFSVNGLGGNFYGGEMANVAVTATPEPASLALLGTGLVAIGGIAARRRRRPTA